VSLTCLIPAQPGHPVASQQPGRTAAAGPAAGASERAAPAGHSARERGRRGLWRGQPHRREPEGPRGDGPASPIDGAEVSWCW